MQLARRDLIIPLVSAAVLGLVAAIYCAFAQPLFESKGEATVRRLRLENLQLQGDVKHNRWVWTKDGLTVRHEALSDDFLNDVIAGISPLAAEGKDAESKEQLRELLRKQILLDYSGADSDTYSIRAEWGDPLIAQQIVAKTIARIKELAVDQIDGLFASAVDSLEQEVAVAVAGKVPEERRHALESAASALAIERALNAAEAKHRFTVVIAPTLPFRSRWPAPVPIVGVALLTGAILGLGLALASRVTRRLG